MATGYKPNSPVPKASSIEREKEGNETESCVRSDSSGVKKPMASLLFGAVGEDLFCEILLRLPNMAPFVNAALACKRWHRAGSDPAILRRFLPLRRPPLVGFILTDRGDMPFPRHCPNLYFVGATARRPNLASATAYCNIFFVDLPGIDSDEGGGGCGGYYDKWRLHSFDGGRLLLSHGWGGFNLAMYAIVVDDADADASFRVIGMDGDIFFSRTHKWALFDHAAELYHFTHSDGMPTGRFVYLGGRTPTIYRYHENVERLLLLDMTTMEWTVIVAPFPAGESYCVSDMAGHGGLCLVSSKEQNLQLWVRSSSSNGGWLLKKEISLLDRCGYFKKLRREEWMKRVRVLAAKSGYVLHGVLVH
ncbi:hypothetical protein E2562_034595 [Oryza meyeriana var. granulata]|uniref:F-box protein AT5G49610-like beta-propeller domain-containing protein n=1 Tax=Oryza meyeriana var. granulata TaxID=110450 RepID=A0A6G1DRI0_9ORYZ|nr:hypothetical protein E2562_034595 [Oryza meyeriana var. granulata]